MSRVQRKVCLLGDFAVGKTSLVRRYIEGRFDDSYLSTIGVKISRRVLEREAGELSLLIWDLAGGTDFEAMQSRYLRGAAGALIVCDLTRADTLEGWTRHVAQLRAINESAAIVLIANKADLEETRALDEATLRAESERLGAPFMVTSAKSGHQVVDAFDHIAEQLESQQ